MHIALIAPLQQPTPPPTYGGLERVVAIHAAELLRLGHRVTVFAAEGSAIPGARTIAYGPLSIHTTRRHLLRLAAALPRCADADVVHSFGRSVALLPWLAAPGARLVQTYQCPLSAPTIARLGRLFGPRISYTVPSQWMRAVFPDPAARVAVVPNALPLEQYTLASAPPPPRPLAFLGRFDPCKGLHTAIDVALSAGVPLLVAGGPFDAASEAYTAARIDRFRNHPLISFLGPVDDAGKQELLGRSRGLLFPIEWDEPFGIVMLEAMACGTPVIAFRRGAVPEVVEEGRSGFIVDSPAQMTAAVADLDRLERAAVRRSFAERFGADAVTRAYLAHYAAAGAAGAKGGGAA